MKTFLAIDFGSGSLKLAEFEARTDGTLLLHRYFLAPMEASPESDGEEPDPFTGINLTLTKVLDENEVRAKGMEANYCISSSQVFAKLLRTPPVEGSKVSQIIMYEAQQNVPFPLEEVQWDYQILGTADTGELDVLLIALRTEVVEGFANLSRKHGMKLQIIDGSTAALRNAYIHNYGEPEDCVLLLDIGAKTTNALFIEGSMFYTRSINIGSYNITQEFAGEAQLDEASAERYKRAHGYVHLGGAFEDSQDPHQAIVSKVARNVMTRLHQQIGQTIQFYRSQQGGAKPSKIYLAGSGSQLVYTANFFQQKLDLEVEYFNPFRNIERAESVDREELAGVAHSMGELVGLGLRKVTVGMTEFNLLPTREKVSREIDRRAPYAVAVVFCVALMFAVFGAYDMSLAKVKQKAAGQYRETAPAGAAEIRAKVAEIQGRVGEFAQRKRDASAIQGFLKSRYVWIHLLNALREAVQQIEPHVKITAFFAGDDKKQILRMDQYPGLVGTDIPVLPWRAVRIEGNNTLALDNHPFEGGEAVRFKTGGVPQGVNNATGIFYVGIAGGEESVFTLHGKEEDAASGENPLVFTEQEKPVSIGPVAHPRINPKWAHHVYWRDHPLIKGNAVRFVGITPTVPRPFSEDESFYLKATAGRTNTFELYSDAEMKPESRVRFADQGVTDQFGIEPVDLGGMAEPDPAAAPQGEGAADAKAAPVERPQMPWVDAATSHIVWPKHGLKDTNGTAVRFVGPPTNWPKGLQAVKSETLFFVEPRGPNWVALHDRRSMDENTRVVFAGLPPNGGSFTLKAVPGEFVLDSPRGAGQEVNPKLTGDVAKVLDEVVELGGSYAVDQDTGEVIYVGLVGSGVRRDSVREPVLARLQALKKLKYLEIWKDPSIPIEEWPDYEDKLKAFKVGVPDCSLSLAVPTTIWVRSLVPASGGGGGAEQPPSGGGAGEAGESAAEITGLALKVRAINLTSYYTVANRDFAAMVVKTINGHPYFGGDPETETGSTLSMPPTRVSAVDMFTDFEINVALVDPFPLEDIGGAEALAAVAAGKEGAGAANGNGDPQGGDKEF